MSHAVVAPERAKPGQRIALVAVGALLLVAICLQVFFRWREPEQMVARRPLAESIVRSAEGWSVGDERLGPTEGVTQSVLKTLNLDDYVYRRFRRGALQFTVYAAYWGPGKMPTRLVASHTPDRCWTENGMRCLDMQFRQTLSLGGKPLLPAEVRTFALPMGDEKIHVAYWHTVAGRLYDYGGRFNAVPSAWLWWKDAVTQAAYGSCEQLFVRIASPVPLDRLWAEPEFQRIFASVAALGLFVEPVAGP